MKIKKILTIIIFLVIMLVPSSLGIISKGYKHSNHFYAISYDGEGDAVVRAKIMIVNDASHDLEKLSLEFPGRSIIFYDVFLETPSFSKVDELNEVVTSESTILNINLPEPIKEGKSGSVIIVYKIPKSANKKFGVFNFKFRTIIDPDAKIIENIRVAVNVDQNLHLKGTKAKVDYRMDFFGSSKLNSIAEDVRYMPKYHNSFSNDIMYARGLVKTAQNLDPWESFVIEGKYSKSYLRIHIFQTILLIMILIGSVYGIFLFFRKSIKTKVQTTIKQDKGYFSIAVISGFLQAISLTALWFVGWFILTNLRHWVGYRHNELFAFIIVILLALLMLAVIIMPPVMIGKRDGVFSGFFTFVVMIGWLLIGVVLTLIFFSLFFRSFVVY